jgi:hypothetical protein
MESVAQGQIQGSIDGNFKDLVVPMSWWLRDGPSWARNLSRSGGLTCAHRCVSTAGRPTPSCDTGLAPGTDGNWKDPVPGCFSVPMS